MTRRDTHRDELIARHLPLARRLVRRFHGTTESPEDLQQVACIGLIKAVDRFDPARGERFDAFAVPYVLGELRRHFRDHTWSVRVPRALQELSLRLTAVEPSLASQLGRAPTVAELATATATAHESVLEALDVRNAYRAASLDAELADEDELSAALLRSDAEFDRAELRATLAPLLGTLSDHDREIVRLRFEEDLTQDEIAARLQVSQMQVSRRLRRSLSRLQALGERAGPPC